MSFHKGLKNISCSVPFFTRNYASWYTEERVPAGHGCSTFRPGRRNWNTETCISFHPFQNRFHAGTTSHQMLSREVDLNDASQCLHIHRPQSSLYKLSQQIPGNGWLPARRAAESIADAVVQIVQNQQVTIRHVLREGSPAGAQFGECV